MEDLSKRCAALRAQGDHAAELMLLLNPGIDASPLNRMWIDSRIALNKANTGNYTEALQIHLNVLNSWESNKDTWNAMDHGIHIETLGRLGKIYSMFAYYDLSFAYYQRALVAYQTLPSRLDEKVGRTLAQAVCHMKHVAAGTSWVSSHRDKQYMCRYCNTIGQHPVLCECQRSWYCSAQCAMADAPKHEASVLHFRLPLDEIPADVVRHHILPFCIANRTTGLWLRTLNKRWCKFINEFAHFWEVMVTYDWTLNYRTLAQGLAGVAPRYVHVLKIAKDYREWQCKEAATKLKQTRTKIGELKRELAIHESHQQLLATELAALESKVKRAKK